MNVEISIPETLPPGHAVIVTGAFTGGPAPLPAADLTGRPEVAGGRTAPAPTAALAGRMLRRLHRHKQDLAETAGHLAARHLVDENFRPRPVRTVSLDGIRGFGSYGLAVATVNERGEESAGVSGLTRFLVPPPLPTMHQELASYDPDTDTAVFGVEHETLR